MIGGLFLLFGMVVCNGPYRVLESVKVSELSTLLVESTWPINFISNAHVSRRRKMKNGTSGSNKQVNISENVLKKIRAVLYTGQLDIDGGLGDTIYLISDSNLHRKPDRSRNVELNEESNIDQTIVDSKYLISHSDLKLVSQQIITDIPNNIKETGTSSSKEIYRQNIALKIPSPLFIHANNKRRLRQNNRNDKHMLSSRTHVAHMYPPMKNDPNMLSRLGNDPNMHSRLGNDPNMHSRLENNPNVHSRLENDPNMHSRLGNDPNMHSRLENDPNMYSRLEIDPNMHSRLENDPNMHSRRGNDPNMHSRLGNDPNMHSRLENGPNVHPNMYSRVENYPNVYPRLENYPLLHFKHGHQFLRYRPDEIQNRDLKVFKYDRQNFDRYKYRNPDINYPIFVGLREYSNNIY